MGSSGGSSSSQPQTQIVDAGRPQNIPLEPQLVTQFGNALESAAPYAQYGYGANLAPRAPFGQTYVPGPNKTIYGDPFNPNNGVASFGQSTVAQQPAQSMFAGQGQAGGSGTGGGGGGQQDYMSLMANFLGPLFGFPQGANVGGSGGGAQQPGPATGGTAYQPNYTPPAAPPQPSTPAAPAPQPNNQQQALAQPVTPSGKDAPDPWVGTNNARTQNNPGSNWTPQGTYNANGPYYPSPPVGANGLPQPAQSVAPVTNGGFLDPSKNRGIQ